MAIVEFKTNEQMEEQKPGSCTKAPLLPFKGKKMEDEVKQRLITNTRIRHFIQRAPTTASNKKSWKFYPQP
jgi:hypothetical protein